MKLTKEQLKKIIQEEIQSDLTEQEMQEIFGLGKAARQAGQQGLDAMRSFRDRFKKPAAQPTQTDTPPPAAAQQAPAAAPVKFTPPVEDATGEPVQKPAAAQPETPPAAAQQAPAAAKDPVTDSTADIVMPHAKVLSTNLVPVVGQSLQKVLGGLPQDQRKAVMTPVMQYLQNLPKMASQVLAEEMTPQQQALKAKLAAKHGGNISLIGKNLQNFQQELVQNIKSFINPKNVEQIFTQTLGNAMNTKEGKRYLESIKKNPQAHVNAFLQNAEIVVKNIVSIVQKNMPKAPEGQSKLGAPQQPGANAAAMAKKQAAAKPAAAPAQQPAPVAESYKATYNKWQKIIKG